MGCKDAVENFVKDGNIRKVQKGLCSKIYQEAKQLSAEGKVSPYDEDLFLEQSKFHQYFLQSCMVAQGCRDTLSILRGKKYDRRKH